MTSLAVHLNYNNNISTPREKHNISRNNNSNINNNNSNLNSNVNGVNKSIDLNNNNSDTNKSSMSKQFYNLNGGVDSVNSNNVSANYALINRIKAFETQKKQRLINQPILANQQNGNKNHQSTNGTTSVGPANKQQTVLNNNSQLVNSNNNGSTFNSNSNSFNNPKLNLNNHLIMNDDSSQQFLMQNTYNNKISNGNVKNNDDLTDVSNTNISSTSPTFERKSVKGGSQQQQRNSSKSQDDFYRYRLKSANPNAYHDKITDQKFFNRNFKLKNTETLNSNANSNNDLNYNSLNGGNSSSFGMQRYIDDSTAISVNPGGVVDGSMAATPNAYHVSRVSFEREKSGDLNQRASSAFNNGQSLIITNISNNLTNQNVNSHVNNQLNKLKLLKKRNALKKTITNQSPQPQLQGQQTSTTNFESFMTSSKDDFKSQNSLNNRPLSMNYLSRNSLNNLEQTPLSASNLSGSNQQLKQSSETIDEIMQNETMKLKESQSNLDKVRSTSRGALNVKYLNTNGNINNQAGGMLINNHNKNGSNTNLTNQTRTKSENELHNLNESTTNPNSRKYFYKNEYDSNQENNNKQDLNSYTAYKSLNINNSFINRMKTNNTNSKSNFNSFQKSNNKSPTPNSRLENGKYNNSSKSYNNKNIAHNEDIDDYDNVRMMNDKEFRIVYPNYNPNISMRNATNNINSELFEISPYNIMSDPVISEQFRRLYEEDEYFQQVHRKVSEWLNKYVFIEMENQTFINDQPEN